ncbi:MAG: glycosyltransferase [Pseudomonadota bacterium]
MKTKHTILFLLIIILVVGIFKGPKIKRYFLEERYYSLLVKLGITKRCYNPYKDLANIFTQENLNYQENNRKVVLDSLAKIPKKEIVEGPFKIPSITHQVYFTPAHSKKPLKDFYIEKLKVNFNKLNATDKNWQHYIWTNNPEIFTDEIRNITGVEIKSIDEFKEHVLYKILIETIDKGKDLPAYFAESSDLFRLLALERFGGVYNDMDYEIYNASPLVNYMKRFDFIGGREKVNSYSYYGNSFMAAKSNHPIIKEAVTRLIKNYFHKSTCNYIKYPCTENDRLYFNGPPLITLAYFAKNNIDGNNDVILPSWMIFNLYFARHKNQYCDYSKITREDFVKRTNNLEKLLNDFIEKFQMKDIEEFYKIRNSDQKDPDEQNIYYDTKYRKDFEVIGADLGCGTWVTSKNPRHWYWN